MSEPGSHRKASGATRCNNNGLRGFRVNNTRKLSIQRLRVRFLHFFKVLFDWRKSYERAAKSFKNGITFTGGVKESSYDNINSNNNKVTTYNNDHNNNNNIHNKNSVKTRLITEEKRRPGSRLRSLARNNSFYTEAIADCLEFIKRNSLSVDDPHNEATPIAACCP